MTYWRFIKADTWQMSKFSRERQFDWPARNYVCQSLQGQSKIYKHEKITWKLLKKWQTDVMNDVSLNFKFDRAVLFASSK